MGVLPRLRPRRLLDDRPRPARQPAGLRRLRARLGHEGGDPVGRARGGRGRRRTPCSASTGTSRPGDRVVTDAHDHAPIDWTVTGILAKSSNVGTIMLAREVGDEKLEHYLRAFGLGSTTGIELPGESAGILQDSDGLERRPRGQRADRPGRLGDDAADGLDLPGDRQRRRARSSPAIVDVGHRPGRPGHARRPQPESTRVISEATAEQMAYMLEAVVGPGGTAPLGQIEGFRVAGQDRHRAAGQPGVQLLRGRRLRDDVRRLRAGRRPAVRRRGRPGAADQLRRGRPGRRAGLRRHHAVRAHRRRRRAVGTARPDFVLTGP